MAGHWARSQSGQYYQKNTSGKTLAHVYRYRGFWHATVAFAGEGGREYNLRESFRTLKMAQSTAEGVYREMTAELLKRRQRSA